MNLKKVFVRLCPVGTYALKSVVMHVKIVVMVVLALATIAICYVVLQQGIFDPKGEPREVVY